MHVRGIWVSLFVTALLLAGGPGHAALRLEIAPIGLDEAQATLLRTLALEDPNVKKRLEGCRYRVLGMSYDELFPEKERARPSRGTFELGVYDYTHDRLLKIRGDQRGTMRVEVEESEEQPRPSPEEYEDALAILRADPSLGGTSAARWKPYQAMPGIIRPDLFSRSTARVIAVGLIPLDASFRHEIVGVDLSRQKILRYPGGAPLTTLAEDLVCAPPGAWQAVTPRGTPGQAVVKVMDDDVELWKFEVVRPSVSSGDQGSAIDLRNIEYKGMRLISQIHNPILNVLYEDNVCGPYRDWQYSEDMFQAEGTLIAGGILQASGPAQTIFESGSDRGTFRGVAVFSEGDETVLMTELQAGWYRYKSEYRFARDGTIRPKWGFAAVQNSCTCYTHHHHSYWRIDFDLGAAGAANTVEVFKAGEWNPVTKESKFMRAPETRWRIRNLGLGRDIEITPGAHDGKADAYGKGDAWVFKYWRGEIDDSALTSATSAAIDGFLTGETVENTDLVFWYAGHFLHITEPLVPDGNHVVGPTLKLLGP